MNTIKIGNQEWMQINLAIDDGGEGIHYNPENKQYYYTWDAAMRIAQSINGWHLPSSEEWNTAAEACGAEVVDNAGMDDPYLRDYECTESLYDALMVLPTGCFYDGSFRYVGSYAYFWSATEKTISSAYDRYFGTSNTMDQRPFYKGCWFSVRLVKD